MYCVRACKQSTQKGVLQVVECLPVLVPISGQLVLPSNGITGGTVPKEEEVHDHIQLLWPQVPIIVGDHWRYTYYFMELACHNTEACKFG